MQSLSFIDSRIAASGPAARFGVGKRRLGLGCALAALALACGSDDDGGTVPLADSGSLEALTEGGLAIPTTVAVRDGVAWVAESQFNQYPPFNMGVGTPGPFRLYGVPLDGGSVEEIALPPEFFPEGVTASGDGYLFVGSVSRGNIYQVQPDSNEAALFLGVGQLQGSVIGMTVSNDDQMLWVCNSNLGVTPATGAVVGIGISDGEIKVRHELPDIGQGAFCNDLVMSPNGALWITESFGGRLFRIDADELMENDSAELWVQADLELAGLNGPAAGSFGANGIALLGGRLFVANTAYGVLYSIDPSLTDPEGEDFDYVTLEEDGEEVVLVDPDGITALNNRELLIVENGQSDPTGATGRRLVLARMDLQ